MCAAVLEAPGEREWLANQALTEGDRDDLRSIFQLMQLAVPHLEATRGNIVNVSSVTGLRSFPGVLAYCRKAFEQQVVLVIEHGV